MHSVINGCGTGEANIQCPLLNSGRVYTYVSLSTVVLSIMGMGMVPSIIDVWGYDKEFCSSSSPS